MTLLIIVWYASSILWGGFDLFLISIAFVNILAQKLQNMEEISDMTELTLSDSLAWDMIKIIL